MPKYEFEKSDPAGLLEAKTAYLRGLTSPKDGMWATFVDMADHFVIKLANETIGYCIVNAEKALLQFSVNDAAHSIEAIQQALKSLGLKQAFVGTNELEFLTLCKRYQQSETVNAIMYQFDPPFEIGLVEFPSSTIFSLVKPTDLETVVNFGMENLDANRDWLAGYFEQKITANELFGLWNAKHLLATGELRPSASQPRFADVGMIVAKKNRGEGIATNVLRQLVILCRERKLIAICSTESNNTAAQKAIEKAGFTQYGEILLIKFGEIVHVKRSS